MERWTRWVIRFRWAVLAAWVVVLVLSFAAASRLSDLWSDRFALPGTDTQRAADILERHFGQKPFGSFTLVAQSTGPPADALIPAVSAAARRAAAELPTGGVASVGAVSGRTVKATISSKLQIADASDYTDEMRAGLGSVPGAKTYLTGQPALRHDLQPVYERDLKVGELYIALPIALAILIFIFGTLAFLIPFIFALAAIPATLAVVWIFAHWMEMEQTVQNLVTLIGLGIAIDYSLLIVYRYRDELRRGGSREEALVRTMKTAGHAVVFSGTAVAIGLALLLAMPVPAIRGYGLAGLVVPLASLACALTLLPVLLYLIERPLDRVRLIPKRILAGREAEQEGSFWVRLAQVIMRRPLPVLLTAVVLLVASAVPVAWLELGPGTNQKLPANLESTQGYEILSSAVGAGSLAPTDIVIDTGRPDGADDSELQSAVARLIVNLNGDPEVGGIDYSTGSAFVDPSRRYVHLQVFGRHDYGLPPAQDFVDLICESRQRRIGLWVRQQVIYRSSECSGSANVLPTGN